MLNYIIEKSLSNRLIVLCLGVILFIVGIYTTYRAEVDVFPDLNAPTVVVMTEANSMATEEVELNINFPIETAVNGAAGVRRVRSTATNGFSIVWVEFDWDTDIYLARQIVTEKLSAVQHLLPEGVGKPTLGPQSSILGEMMIIGLTSDTVSQQELRTIAEWNIRPRLLSSGGVAQVSVIGGEVREYQILLNHNKMKHYGVSLSEVVQAVEEINSNVNGGIIYDFGNEYIIRGILSVNSLDLISSAFIKQVNTYNLSLSDIAEVKIGNRVPKMGSASVKGKDAVLLTVTKQPNVDTKKLTETIDNSLAEISKSIPKGITISTDIFRQTTFINSSIKNVRTALLEGGIFVVIVLVIFLMNVRTTIISLITLPLSLLVSVVTLHYMGLSINTMSLGGMAIAIGSLVDDAIVDVENVYKRLRENSLKPKEERLGVIKVVFEASKEVRMPILNSTLIIVASFIPLFFLSGLEGRMLIPLGIAFIVALVASTVVSLTITPVLCSYLLGSTKELKKTTDPILIVRLKYVYERSLRCIINHKKVFLSATIAVFLASAVLLFFMGRSFLPPFNEGSFTINISAMPGISLEESEAIGRRAEEMLLTVPEIKTVARKTGRAELDEHALGVNVSEIEAPFELDGRSKYEVALDVRDKLSNIAGANIEIGQPISHRIDAMLSGTRANIAIKLFGDNVTTMYKLANEIKNNISSVEGIVDLNVEQLVERPQVEIIPRREMLKQAGISIPEFSQFISVAMAGNVVSSVYEGNKQFDLRLKYDNRDIKTINDISDVSIDTSDGKKIPISDVAEIRTSMGLNTINRENGRRKIVVSANVEGRDLRSVVDDIKDIVDEKIVLPKDYHIEYGGQFESEETASRLLFITSFISLFVIFLLIYFEFKNVSESFVILLNLPLALIGGVVALYITAGQISIPAIIGFISLFGIATRNGMLLVGRYKHLLSKSGMSLKECVVAGSIDRLNPILMTALSSAFALIPLALGSDLPGNEIQSPMAKVILGGLITSTLLNGFVIPSVYIIYREYTDRKRVEQTNHKTQA